ncbi:unnamed protein product [Allacma fusca]|uniref:Uncharacterized protein n=1 Tax=Allacma fusca TaxID=39272 RepID=A0A8J2KYV3_9HEXA|nr:unnamed protein product [Allacma fusca]
MGRIPEVNFQSFKLPVPTITAHLNSQHFEYEKMFQVWSQDQQLGPYAIAKLIATAGRIPVGSSPDRESHNNKCSYSQATIFDSSPDHWLREPKRGEGKEGNPNQPNLPSFQSESRRNTREKSQPLEVGLAGNFSQEASSSLALVAWSNIQSTWFRWFHRLFDLTQSLLKSCSNSCRSHCHKGSHCQHVQSWLYKNFTWLRTILLYPSKLHYMGRKVLIAAITFQVLLRTLQNLNLDFNQLLTNSDIHFVYEPLLGVNKEFHFL